MAEVQCWVYALRCTVCSHIPPRMCVTSTRMIITLFPVMLTLERHVHAKQKNTKVIISLSSASIMSSKQQFDMSTMTRCSKELAVSVSWLTTFLCDSYIPFHYSEQTHDCKPQCFIETTVARSQVTSLIAHMYIMSVMWTYMCKHSWWLHEVSSWLLLLIKCECRHNHQNDNQLPSLLWSLQARVISEDCEVGVHVIIIPDILPFVV